MRYMKYITIYSEKFVVWLQTTKILKFINNNNTTLTHRDSIKIKLNNVDYKSYKEILRIWF